MEHPRSETFNKDPLAFLNSGFYEDNLLRFDLLDKHAKDLGEGFAHQEEQRGRKRIKVSSGQIRRFFGDVRELEGRISRERDSEIFKSSDPKQIAPYLALIKLLKSKAAYADGRDTVTSAFRNFIAQSVDKIETPRDFRAFVLFFEAIVGYFYGAGGERNR